MQRTEATTAGTGSYRAGPQGVAMRALIEHTQSCEQCVNDARECPTGRALAVTVRTAGREAPRPPR